jgi:hypothetical protein
MSLQFVGMKDGHPKVFTPEELGAWICGKVNRYIEPQNAKKCAEYVLAHKEGSDGDIGQKLDGEHSIFHISHGKKNGDDGCTCFFASREGKHAVIVGIGWHKTDTSYRLDYKHGSWNQAGKNIVQL